ncbi:MAG TPA: hypothetical protein PLP25_01780 [Candidatus Limiplasma sp.]|mgnify:CR=1 FL=1|nr:hypothetical protein [Candidatus Limiplasma sp.]HPS80576.1 hypothetical protein [Candidatus Limiplasma sp.]
MTRDQFAINGQSLIVTNEVVPGQGEDSYAAETDALGGLICVADGCGGIGSRRYAKLQNHTEAFVAARLVAACTREWVSDMDGRRLPCNPAEANACAAQLTENLRVKLTDFHTLYRNAEGSRIIMRDLQRTLPTTLCAALIDARARKQLSSVFFWAGDSRGYVLSTDGLRQCTADHVVGHTDAMENLYRDSRLSNMVNADRDFYLDAYGLTVATPCVVLTATDGCFGYLPTPMEFELLLLTTLQAANDLVGWRTRLRNALGKLASDDSTLVMACYGVDTYAELKEAFAQRRAALQAKFVTPVRRRRQNLDFARGLWEDYRQGYELNEEVLHADWRL